MKEKQGQDVKEIIEKHKEEVDKRLSESELLKIIKNQAEKIKANLLNDCSNLIFRYSKTKYLGHNLWSVTDIGTCKTGVISGKGEQIIPCIYDYDIEFLDGTDDFLVSKTILNKMCFGLANIMGQEIIEPKYEDFYMGFIGGIWAVKLNGKWGFIDKKENIVIPFIYDEITLFHDDKSKVVLNGETFYIDKTGKRVS